jgi:hypothetical protein
MVNRMLTSDKATLTVNISICVIAFFKADARRYQLPDIIFEKLSKTSFALSLYHPRIILNISIVKLFGGSRSTVYFRQRD